MNTKQTGTYFSTREFHVSWRTRNKYKFSDVLFSTNGEVILADFNAVRVFTQLINEKRDLENYPEETIHASELNALGLIHEILHLVISKYKEQQNSSVITKALSWLSERFSVKELDQTFSRFIEEFPTVAVFQNKLDAQSYLDGFTGDIPNREIILEEMLLLWLENMNPAFSPFRELFDDLYLSKATNYQPILEELKLFFNTQPFFGPDNQNLIDMLRKPAVEVPDSLQGQLRYISEHWAYLLGDHLLRLLKGLDFLSEEKKLRGLGPGETKILEYGYSSEDEYERFSPDRDWMPRVVMIAKNVYVWLHQLSKQYAHSISRLDEIPDEELDCMADYGFTALWLIGLWERSQASKEIKRLCGNPEAEASAYSLTDYVISHTIGGQDAFENLRHRCWQRGIRMASDMVPNHTGIDSKWVMEHPDWFLSLDHPPFPSYSFSGKNLSNNDRVGIYLEDNYYNRRDAAVVFKRVDHRTGDKKYIYHGNDGTAMPWNDTAQLNFLNPAVREAIIQTILHVARNFPIIRFDAAMTLAKKQYQRLWFPEPGTGSDIPTRAEFGLTKPEFNNFMPAEFWREVVDRVAEEIPDTLLLAEAFWMMEGYFVRTLGMHRVYNSAFMNMLKMEENAKYRITLKNTLEFDPEILKRFVNFLNNPDEETAAKQFGKGDKYFGVTMMMITMPGLPMFGHGQIEGFEEKYGMEYKQAYWEESPDAEFINRHKREIFPIVKKRYLFSGVSNFLLYDFWQENGSVNENVFVYSNRFGDERALVLFNNAYERACGWVRTSVAYNNKQTGNENQDLHQKNLGEGLGLTNSQDCFVIFREHISGLEFIRNSGILCENGFYAELNGYQYQVFWDMREVRDNEFRHYEKLHNSLAGQGVPSMDEAVKKLSARRMDVLYVAAEVSPFSKVGGLADVAGSLPRELVRNGKKTVVISPLYATIDRDRFEIFPYPIKGMVQLLDTSYPYEIFYKHASSSEPGIFFVFNDYFFNRPGIYTDENGKGYPDNNARFFFFQYVILDLITKGHFAPVLIHCNDHQMALLPWMIKNRGIAIPSLLTIHNFQYQGWFNNEESRLLDRIDQDKLASSRKAHNALEIGLNTADWINTVSHNYASELLKNESLSFGLYDHIKTNRGHFSGILNGVDYSVWNPENDPLLNDHFSWTSLEGKLKNKEALVKECGFESSSDVPVIGSISRLVDGKGFDLILEILDELIREKFILIILGTGDPDINDSLQVASGDYPERICFINRFDERLAHLIEAGSDLFLMPSRFEPCGLNQIYSLKYGTIPIVHHTGGLADTVRDWNGKDGTGFVFKQYQSAELLQTVKRALKVYRQKTQWRRLIKNAMAQDFSWNRSAKKYLHLYAEISGNVRH